MDYLENSYSTHIPELKQYAPNASEDVLKAIQHFIGTGGAKVYLKSFNATKDYSKAQETIDAYLKGLYPNYKPDTNTTVQNYLSHF